ncbi:hypothetical protein [Pseudoalteromonas mariniglutinosa]|uniref:hypothetical protein n=1 Tax=Pseudoalteromonas mariniglutinosa TaxID=206042 RepID=UPI00384ECF99
MKITPTFTSPAIAVKARSSEPHLGEKKPQDENEKKYTLSKFLDAKAQEYSDDDVNFADNYKNLQKVYDDLEKKVAVLQEQVNKLKQDPIQRHLKLDSPATELVNTETRLTVAIEPVAVKKYKSSQQQIDILEGQLAELQSKKAAVKQQMIEMVITEMKKRDNDEYKM